MFKRLKRFPALEPFMMRETIILNLDLFPFLSDLFWFFLPIIKSLYKFALI